MLCAQGQAQVLDEAALQQETALQAKVTLEVIKKPLAEMLELMRQQSKVNLSYTPDSPAKTVLVTARFNQMTLADALCALARLYGVQWQKTEGGFVMHPYPNDDLHLRLLHRKGMAGLFDTNDLQEERKETAALTSEIYDSVPENSWKQPGGVALTVLPAELREKLRVQVIGNKVLKAASQVRYEEQAANAELELRLGSIAHDAQVLFPLFRSQINASSGKFLGPGWALYTDKNELVIPVFPEMHGPSPLDKEREAALRQRQAPEQKANAKPAR